MGWPHPSTGWVMLTPAACFELIRARPGWCAGLFSQPGRGPGWWPHPPGAQSPGMGVVGDISECQEETGLQESKPLAAAPLGAAKLTTAQ